MFIKRKLLIEYRKLLIKNIKLDSKLKRRQIMANIIDIWRFEKFKEHIEEEMDNNEKPRDKIHI